MYVLSLDVAPLDSLTEKTIWRFIDDLESAQDRYHLASACAREGTILRAGNERVQVLGARLYEIDSEDRIAARNLVKQGKGRPLLDTEKPLVHLTDEELKKMWEDVFGDGSWELLKSQRVTDDK